MAKTWKTRTSAKGCSFVRRCGILRAAIDDQELFYWSKILINQSIMHKFVQIYHNENELSKRPHVGGIIDFTMVSDFTPLYTFLWASHVNCRFYYHGRSCACQCKWFLYYITQEFFQRTSRACMCLCVSFYNAILT